MHDERKQDGQFETDITTMRALGDGSNEPGLTHTGDHADDAKGERDASREAVRKLLGLVVVLGTVSTKATANNEVVSDSDTGIDSQPIGDEVHQVLENFLEVRVSRDSNGNRDARGQEHPDKTRNSLSLVTQDLKRERNGVDIGAVVGDNGEGEDNQTELAESAERFHNSPDDASVSRLSITSCVLVVSIVNHGRSGDSDAQELSKEERRDQATKSSQENLAAAAVRGLINGIISGITGPSRSKTIDGCTIGQDRADLSGPGPHGNVPEIPRVSKHAEDNHEDDEGWDPAVELIQVNDLVSSESNEECADGDDQNACKTRNVAVDGIEQLGADNRVGRRPTQAGQDIQKSDCAAIGLARRV